jgi:hypothetical protein
MVKKEEDALEMTQREKDILDTMIAATRTVLDSDKKRVCFPPSAIRNVLQGKYPDLKVFHVTSSQKNLELLGLITKILEAGNGEKICGAVPPSTYEINEEFYRQRKVVIIAKHKPRNPAGTFKKPPVTLDKTKATLKNARELLARKKLELEVLGKEHLALKKNLDLKEARLNDTRDVIKVISDLLAIRRKNLKRLGLLKDVE